MRLPKPNALLLLVSTIAGSWIGMQVVHETGHEVFGHLSGCVPGYNKRIEDIWLGTSDTNVGLGGYNANNVHENMAVFMQMFGYADRREDMYRTNYKQAVALGEYLPGEMVIGLDANCNLTVDSGGVVTSWAWISRPRPKQPLDRPFAYALIKLDGADTAMLHAVTGVSEADMSTGMRVSASWIDEPVGHIHDIASFVPEG